MNTVKFAKKDVKMVAHRGLSGIERENTNAAFVAAGNRSYYGIETDVVKTADGQFVLNHDGDLKRVAGERVVVGKNTLDRVQSILLTDTDGERDRQDLRTPLLGNYIKICKRYDKEAVLELKDPFTREDVRQIIEIIKGYDYLNKVTFISFHYENLLFVRSFVPNQSAQFLDTALTFNNIARCAADSLDVDIKYTALTPENIKAAHAAGLKVNCWTVDDPEVAEKLALWGVDYITSNILE